MTELTMLASFLWGAATAAHQIEGGNTNSDWWALEHSGAPHIVEPSGDACDSYHRYPEDIRLLAEAGLTTYRFSVEWARIEPAEGEFSRAQLLHYRAVIDTCHDLGITPVVTLHHFTTPRWFVESGGWKRPDVVELFARYVGYVCQILHDVEWVVTINEPNMVALFATFSPREGDQTPTIEMSALPAPDGTTAELLVRMHRAAVAVVRERTGAKVGWSIAAQAFTPTPGNEAVWERTFQQWEGVFYDGCAGDDFVGVQSYTSQPVDANGPVPHPDSPDNTQNGMAFRPDAVGICLRQAWERTHLPIFVTENGIATDDDARRVQYVTGALEAVSAAIADGVPVLGYLYWSLLDNYEWGSYHPTFGLIGVDRAGDFARTPKPSLAWLGGVARGFASR